MRGDRHGRTARVDNDPRRRPTEGYRLRDTSRFRRILHDAIAALPQRLSGPLAGATIHIEDLPPPTTVAAGGQVVLATLDHRVLTVYRRPVERRAQTRAGLEDAMMLAVGLAVVRALGLDDDLDDLFD